MHEEKERFVIDDLEQLNWAFRKLSELKEKEDEVTTLAKSEYERIKEWESTELKTVRDSMEYFTFIIKEYHEKQLEVDPKRKTLSTPYGKSKTRVTREQPKLANKDAALEFVKSNGLTDLIKEEVKWSDLKKTLSVQMVDDIPMVVNDDGQVVPGIEVEPAKVTFSVDV